MKTIFTFLISFLLITNVIKAQTPDAGFTFTNVCYGSVTQFTDTSSGAPLTFYWDFGDGNTSNSQNPSHMYNAPGAYTVMFVATNGGGSDTTLNNVTVFSMPIVNAGTDVSLCPGSNYIMNATASGNGLSYTWIPAGDVSNQNILNPIATPTANTNFTLTVIDINGCMVSDAIFITVYPLITNGFNTADVSCNGGSNGSASAIPTGGIPPYYYNWTSLSSSLQTVTNLAAGSYPVDITDANGCMISDVAQINQPLFALDNSFFITDETCSGTQNGIIDAYISGGTAPYNIIWSNGQIDTLQISNLSSGTYIVDIMDYNYCTLSDTAFVSFGASTTSISGKVKYLSNPISSGTVYLYKKDTANNLTSYYSETQVDGNGNYQFISFPVGTYVLKAYGDTNLYNCVSTYYPNTALWSQASSVAFGGCNDVLLSADIDLVELPLNSGIGIISGQLIEGEGFGQGTKAPGEPIPDIDITVDQSPGGQVMAATVTDINGNFFTEGLPFGTYTVNADIYGYTISLGQITLDAASSTFDITLCTDSSNFEIDSCDGTPFSIHKIQINERAMMYPNPTKDMLHIEYNGKSNLTVVISDISGKVIMNHQLRNNYNTINVSSLSKGMYLVRLKDDTFDSIQKLLIE